MSPVSSRESEPAVSLKTWIAVLGATLGAFLAVLNIQITNASLPYIEGGIGTGGVYGTWISTAYLIGEIIVIPLTDFLSRVFSLRRYLIVNTVLFLMFSVLCGQAQSLSEMIIFRVLQGFAGGVMIPLAFTVIMTMLPRSKQAIGLAGFSISATFGDIDPVQRHDRHQLRTRLHILADLYGAHTDGAVERRGDCRVAEVEFGLPLDRPLLQQIGTGLLQLSMEDGDLLLCAGDASGVSRPQRLCLQHVGLRLLRLLDGAVTVARQLVIAPKIFLRIDERRSVRDDRLPGLVHSQMLLCDLLYQRLDDRSSSLDIGAGLGERRLVIARIDPGEELTRLHRLVVVDRHRDDVAGYLRRDDRRVRVDIGVVGAYEIPAGCPVVAHVIAGGEDARNHGHA
jgi:hypothetical protein